MIKFTGLIACVALVGCGGTTTRMTAEQTVPPVTQPVTAIPVPQLSDQPVTITDFDPDPIVMPIPASDLSAVDPNVTTSFGNLVNGVRMDNGVGILTFDARLGGAAQDYADLMLSEDRFSHIGSDGTNAGDRARAAGYNFSNLRENIARGQADVETVFGDWQGSEGHRENNLAGDVEDFGIGMAGNGADTRWVLMMGSERP